MPKEQNYSIVGIMASNGQPWGAFSSGRDEIEAAENAVKELSQRWKVSEDQFLVIQAFRGHLVFRLLLDSPTPAKAIRSVLKRQFPQAYP